MLQSFGLLAVLPAITTVGQVTDQESVHTSMEDSSLFHERLKNNFGLMVLYFFDTKYEGAAGHLECLFLVVVISAS